MNATCPHCGEEVELDSDHLSDSACDKIEGDCPVCDSPVFFGWYATATMEKL
jgi:endogenous inhibitor of DNA gyrase (YacG/DUF329 family)